MCTVLSPYFCPYNVVSLTHTHIDNHPFSPVSNGIWSAARSPGCLHARLFVHVCVTVSICLCRATLTFIFLICCVTTYGLLDQSRPAPTPEANNLSWSTFRCVMCPDSQTHLDYFTVINTRRIHLTKRDMFTEEFPSHHYKSFHYFIFNTASKLLLNSMMLNWSSFQCVIGQIIFHATFPARLYCTEVDCVQLICSLKRPINKRKVLVLCGIFQL